MNKKNVNVHPAWSRSSKPGNAANATDEGLSPKRLALKKTILALHYLLFLIFSSE